MRIILAASVLVLAAIPLAAGSPEGDWPQFGGPSRDNTSPEKGLLQEWPKEGPPLLWKVQGLGPGYASVSLVGDRIYTMGDRGKDGYLIALERDGGKEVWRTRAGENWGDGGQRCTPTVSDGLVYALTPHGDLLCAGAGDGKERWRKNLKEDFGGEMMSGWGYSESPLVDGEKLLCTPGAKDAAIVALDRKTGDLIWKAAMPEGKNGAGYASIVVSEACGVRQYVQLMGRGVIGVAAEDGKFLWGYKRVANGTANIPTPVVKGDLVFASTAYGAGAALLRIEKAGDGLAAKEVCFLKSGEFQNHHGGMVLSGGHIYAGHGHGAGAPVCIDSETGKIVWKAEAPGGGSAGIACADGRLYFRFEDGAVALVEATPEEYRLKGRFQTPKGSGPAWPHPVIAGGKLYLRWADILLCYDVKAGKEGGAGEAGGKARLAP
jgi:outer membrane protein assembly factor BamB